jgi:hypothetical protein
LAPPVGWASGHPEITPPSNFHHFRDTTGAILLEQNHEWAVQRSRYMTLETIAPIADDPIVGLPAMAD